MIDKQSFLTDKIQADLKQAQLDRDEIKVSTLRLLLSEIKNTEIAKGQPLDDATVISVIQKEVKKRVEAASSFRQGQREQSAVKEENEAKILQSYLPAQISNEELTKIVDEAIKESGAVNPSDMGKVIGMVIGKVGAGADGTRVSFVVKERLTND